MVLILGMTGPLEGKSGRAGKRHFPINHENAPVGSAIRAIHPPGGGGMVIGEFASRFPHHSDVRIVETPTRTNAIEKEAHFNARPGALAKGVAKLTAHFIGMEDVRRKVDCLLGGTNRFQHRGKIFVSVREKFDLVAFDRDRIGQRQGRTEEFRITDSKGMREVILQGMTPNEKEAEDQNDCQETEKEHDPFGQRELPPALIQPM